MDNDKKEQNPKSVWNDISKAAKRITAVITAVGVFATFIIKVFGTPSDLTYVIGGAMGAILLLISFYVDKQSFYLHQEIIEYEEKSKKDFYEIMKKAKQETYDMKKDSNDKISLLDNNIKEILEISKETQKDTTRIQLLMVIQQQPNNVDTILKLAERYFVKLKGDWYATSEFNKWVKEHDVGLPIHIYNAICNNNHEQNK